MGILWAPNSAAQQAFCASSSREVLYGGAPGGGKTDALVAMPTRWAHNPEHRAILLRRTKSGETVELEDRLGEFIPQAVPGSTYTKLGTGLSRWSFPAGGYLMVGAMANVGDEQKLKSFQFNWIGFDELTGFAFQQYAFMFTRNRSTDPTLPLHMRGGTNPDGDFHAWVYERFVESREPYRVYTEMVDVGRNTVPISRQFIPSTAYDNPAIGDVDAYLAGMAIAGKDIADVAIGKWGVFGGQMFPYRWEQIPVGTLASPNHFVIRCMDYGWTDPTVVYWLVGYRDAPYLDIIAELHEEELTVSDIATLMRHEETRLTSYGIQARSPIMSVADPSINKKEGTSGGRTIDDLFQEEGIWWERANNVRIAGWANLRNLFGGKRIREWEGAAPQLNRTLRRLVRHKDPGKQDDIQPRQRDHCADALRYGGMAYLELNADSEEPTPTPVPRGIVQTVGQDRYFDRLVGRLQRDQESGNFGDIGEGW